LWTLAALLGAVQAWNSRYSMSSDGIQYLDTGDAYLRRDWHMALNGCYSPLYAWLLTIGKLILKSSLAREAAIVHLVNFLIYLGALSCFQFCLAALVRYQAHRTSGAQQLQCAVLPEWAWLGLGYTLFLWTSLRLITVSLVTPDMSVAALVYLSYGVLLRIRLGSSGYAWFGLLGAALGTAYLAKSAMLPVALAFLLAAVAAVPDRKKALPSLLIAAIVFLSLATPLVVALSRAKGRVTLGDASWFNYAGFVNRLSPRWHGAPSGTGIPLHPVQQVFREPPAFYYATSMKASDALAYDPPYWLEGVTIRFSLKQQAAASAKVAEFYYHTILQPLGALSLGALILFFYTDTGGFRARNLLRHCALNAPVLAAFLMYSLVWAEERYIGAFVTLFWVGLLSYVCLPVGLSSRRLIGRCSALMLLLTLTNIGPATAKAVFGTDESSHGQWATADVLTRAGLRAGDRIAVVGHLFSSVYWARLARLRIVADVPEDRVDQFWSVDPMTRSQLMAVLAGAGVRAIVAEGGHFSFPRPGWRTIGTTSYYLYYLEPATQMHAE